MNVRVSGRASFCQLGFGLWGHLAASSWAAALAVFALTHALPGLAVTGRRTRPWMALVAAGIPTVFFAGLHTTLGPLVSWTEASRSTISNLAESTALNFIYGAVMLYGTDPLPRSTTSNPSSSLPKPR